MKIKAFSLHFYEGQISSGIVLNIMDEKGNSGWGDIAPLPNRSDETLADSQKQLNHKKQEIIAVDWNEQTFLKDIEKLQLLPSVLFGLESALLSILNPLPEHRVATSALLMGSPEEIRQQAERRYREGYTSAKLKVNNLSFEKAAQVIHQLKDKFRLRIDVNRAWKTSDSLRFFEQFPVDTFDYVEEPFQNPRDLRFFSHPLAVDESFPQELSLNQLESLPTLKALIYKPTIRGGMSGCLSLHEWTAKRGLELVLSSSFESDLGLAHVASMAHRLSLSAPVGIGTYHYLNQLICVPSLQFFNAFVHIPAQPLDVKLPV